MWGGGGREGGRGGGRGLKEGGDVEKNSENRLVRKESGWKRRRENLGGRIRVL